MLNAKKEQKRQRINGHDRHQSGEPGREVGRQTLIAYHYMPNAYRYCRDIRYETLTAICSERALD
jgi:hypothetical protein